jgi:murein DD-endopeptidase MepM/ murein hydrolase activator NlpD
MFVFILCIYFFINTLDPTLAYFENGQVGDGINNSIGADNNTCIKRYNLNKFSNEVLCNFDINIREIRNRWENGKYIVKVFAELPNRFVQRVVNNKCTLSVFNKCFSFKEIVTESSLNTNWEYISQFAFKDNPEKTNLKVLFKEQTSNFQHLVYIKVPPAKYPIGDFQLPIDQKYIVTQEFGKTEFSKFHTGIDFGVKKVKIFSVADGIVEYAGEDITSSECNNGGKIIRIRHNNGLYSAYFHLEKIKVEDNQRISKGDLIGISGNSGQYNCKSMGYHLHFEIRDGLLQKDVISPRAIFSSI